MIVFVLVTNVIKAANFGKGYRYNYLEVTEAVQLIQREVGKDRKRLIHRSEDHQPRETCFVHVLIDNRDKY